MLSGDVTEARGADGGDDTVSEVVVTVDEIGVFPCDKSEGLNIEVVCLTTMMSFVGLIAAAALPALVIGGGREEGAVEVEDEVVEEDVTVVVVVAEDGGGVFG